MKHYTRALVTVAYVALGGQVELAAQESLSAAKDLYASAAYEEALTMLDDLKGATDAKPDTQSIDQYRAFCLLALGRKADADLAIEEVVTTDPLYQPSESDASPRVRGAFADVRRRMLPSIAQQKYGLAKATFDRKEYAAAVVQFQAALEVMDDPELNIRTNPALIDLRTLAGGFLELSRAASAPPPAPEREAPAPAPAPIVPVAPRTYTSTDEGVVPPVTLKQVLPHPKTAVPASAMGKGVLEVVINEGGQVESAVLRQSVSSLYDRMLLEAAKGWKYRPAMKDGLPVRFVKIIQVTLEGR